MNASATDQQAPQTGGSEDTTPRASEAARTPREGTQGETGGEPSERQAGSGRYSHLSDRQGCRFTRAGVKRIDYKDIVTLHKLMLVQGKILSRKRTGIAARYQRMVRTAIKRARFMALLPYTSVKQ